MRGRRGRAGVGTIRLEEGRGADWLSKMSNISNCKVLGTGYVQFLLLILLLHTCWVFFFVFVFQANKLTG